MEQSKIYVTHSSNVTAMQMSALQSKPINFIQILSLEQYLKRFIISNGDSLASFYQFYKDLIQQKDSFGMLENQCESLEFAYSVFNFLCECQSLNVDLTTLDESNSLNRQLKSMLSIMNNHRYAPVYKEISHENNVEFILYNYGSPLNQQLLKTVSPKLTKQNANTSTTITESLNINESLMHICQNIITNNIDVNDVLIVLADNAYLNALLTVFNTFNIPTSHCIDDFDIVCIHLCNTYIQFLKNQTIPNFIECLFAGYKCDFTHLGALARYANYYKNDSTLTLNENSELYNASDITSFNDCYLDLINCYKKACLEVSSNLDIIQAVADYLINIHNSPQFAQQIANIVSIIQEDINTEIGFNFFNYQLQKIRIKKTEFPIDKVLITDIQHPVNQRKYSYIIGLTNSNYPGFNPMNGLFDESFIRFSNYPSASYRQQLNLENLQWIFESGQHLEISLSQNSFDGKAVEYPLFIDKSHIVKLDALHQPDYPPLNVSLNNTASIIAPNGRIKGSVSSLEQYQHCPFSYFLKYIYKLYPYQDLFAVNTIGTIAHGIFSQLYNAHVQNASTDEQSIIESAIDAYCKDLIPLFVHRENQLSVFKERLANTCYSVWNTLKQEEHCQHQTYSEYELFGSIQNFDMKAIIDRVDESEGYFSIIDYKSSEHTLSINAICQGIQLQLITYAYILNKVSVNQLENLIYVNFFAKTESFNPFKLGSKGSETIDLTSENIPIYPIKGYINGKLSNRKYSPETLLNLVDDIYKELFIKMTTQPFVANPDPSACTFCKYKPICRFNGLAQPKEMLVEQPGKEDKDEME